MWELILGFFLLSSWSWLLIVDYCFLLLIVVVDCCSLLIVVDCRLLIVDCWLLIADCFIFYFCCCCCCFFCLLFSVVDCRFCLLLLLLIVDFVCCWLLLLLFLFLFLFLPSLFCFQRSKLDPWNPFWRSQADLTSELSSKGFWSSFNRPFFEDGALMDGSGETH